MGPERKENSKIICFAPLNFPDLHNQVNEEAPKGVEGAHKGVKGAQKELRGSKGVIM